GLGSGQLGTGATSTTTSAFDDGVSRGWVESDDSLCSQAAEDDGLTTDTVGRFEAERRSEMAGRPRRTGSTTWKRRGRARRKEKGENDGRRR
uniref:Uncharacterized protein n=1 Tax=Cucumis melo TaxID=3656 RepID=A0A9I9E3P2_CUCME